MLTESLDGVQQVEAVAPPLPRHIAVQVPPQTIFDKSDLQWTERPRTAGKNKGATVQEAYISHDRCHTRQGMKEHYKKNLPKLQAGTADRDCFLTAQDVRNVASKLAGLSWRLHVNEAQSVRLFYHQHASKSLQGAAQWPA